MGIYAIEEDDKGNLWLGTRGKGIFQKKGRGFINFTSSDGLADNLVNSIFMDSKKNLWFGTYDGVTCYNSGKFKSYKTTDGLPGKIVYNIYEDKNHYIWIAGNKGITVLKNGKFAKDTMIDYLQGVPVTCIFEDPGENVSWIGTHGAGLKRFAADKFTSYTTTEGMTTNFIYQIFDDEKQNLWMTSDTGVLRISKKKLHRFARGEIDRVDCTSFGKSDGMKSLQFHNQFSRNSAFKLRAGEFLFVTKKGIMNLDPEEIIVNKTPPNVVIERVVSNGKNLPQPRSHLSDENVFKGIKDIEFHFTAPTFLSPGKVKFKYKLERYHPDWIFLKPGAERTVQFKNLPYGTYTFRVTACNSDGVWNSNGTSLSFSLEPFLHETFAFKIAVFFILLLLLSGGYLLHKLRLFDRIRKYKNSTLEPSFVEKHTRKLDYLMDIERVYRDENISLQSLAEKLSVTPHQLSQIINKKFNKNFRDFINSFRIEEAKRLLCDPGRADEKIFSVGYATGFNTKVAFNNAFKRHTKMTPSEYKKKYEKNNALRA
jgi:AraC-like DNA-binding protein